MILALLLAGTIAASIEPAVARLDLTSQEADLAWQVAELERTVKGTLTSFGIFVVTFGVDLVLTDLALDDPRYREGNPVTPGIEGRIGARFIQLGVCTFGDYRLRRSGKHKLANIARWVVVGAHTALAVRHYRIIRAR